MDGVGEAGEQLGDESAAAAGVGARVRVGRRALGGDRVRVQQIARLLRYEPDPADHLARRGPVRGAAADLYRPGRRLVHPDERAEQRGLPGAVTAHQGDRLAGAHREGDLPQRLDPPAPQTEPVHGGDRSRGRRSGRVRADPAVQPLAQRRGAAPGVPYGQRQRIPARQPAQRHDRREHRGHRHHIGGRPHDRRLAGTGQQDHLVRVLHHPLQPVLGHQHGRAQVVHQPLEDGQHLFGGCRVQCGRRFVEHQHLGVRGEHGADRDPLLLTAGERRDRPVAQLGEAQQVEGLLHPPAHHVRGDPQ